MDSAIFAVTWWLVLIGGAIAFLFGALWYGPIMGKQWIKALGYSSFEEVGKMGASHFLTSICYSMLVSYAIGVLTNVFVTQSFGGAILIAIFAWLPFTAASSWNHGVYSGSSPRLRIIDSLYDLAIYLGLAILHWLI